MSEIMTDESGTVRGYYSTCRLLTEYLTTYSSCYFCVPVIHVSPFLVGLSCHTERFSVMPIPHKKPTNGLKFFSGSW